MEALNEGQEFALQYVLGGYNLVITGEMGLMYVFNLIVGTGALTMPKAFANAGWLISAIAVIILAFVSYLTTTFVVEAMATANAMQRMKKDDSIQNVGEDESDAARRITERGEDETEPLLGDGASVSFRNTGSVDSDKSAIFTLSERIEMGQMATMFFNKPGRIIFYITLIIYLYGDLAIYAAAVPKSLRDVACTYTRHHSNTSDNASTALTNSDLCWPGVTHVNRGNAYRIFLALFTLTLGPFVFFNVQKTKYLQIFTTVMRWLAFSMMIILTIMYLANGKGRGHPRVANIAGVPNLFGVCVYSFMCHHSLPSLVTPIKKKGKIFTLLMLDYSLILVFYCILSFLGIFTFPNECIQDLYTLDFQPNTKCDVRAPPVTTSAFIQYYLALFPVFTLSTNFPIIAITLRNNLKTLFHTPGRTYRWSVDRIVFPVVTLALPILLAFITDNIQLLVGVTGSFGGSGVQYFVPASLVLLSRKYLRENQMAPADNKHISPFRHKAWPILVFAWAVLCIVFVSINNLMNWIH